MMSFPRDDCGSSSSSSSMPAAPPQQRQHHLLQQQPHPAQMPTAPSQEHVQYSISPGPYNSSTAATILTADQHQQCDLQQRLLQHKPPAVNLYTPTSASLVDVGGPLGAQSAMTSMQQQQHHHVVPSLSKHSSLSELNNPNAIQLHGLLPETSAAASVPGLFLTAPTSSSPAHRRPSVLNSNDNSGPSTSSPLPLAQRLQPAFVDTTSSASILSSSSPDPQQLHRTAAITPFTTCPPLAHRAPPPVAAYPASPHSPAGYGSGGIPSPLQQHQHQQLHFLSVGANAAAPEGLVPFAASTAPPSLPSPGAVATPTTATATSLSVLAGLDDLQQAHERPFRFKVLPPPPTFDGFLMLWETNASDRRSSGATTMGEDTSSNSITQQQQRIAHGGGHSRGGAAPAMERGDVEAVLRASTSERAEPRRSASDFGALSAAEDDGASDGAAPCKAAAAVDVHDKTRISGESGQSTPERRAMVAQYRQILERWWAYMVTFASKPEVRQRLGNMRLCPSFADAHQAAAAASPVGSGSGVLDGVPTDAWQTNVLTAPAASADPFIAEEVVLQAWSTLLLQWWEETKQRRLPRRSRHGAPRRGAPPTRMDDDGVDSTRSGNERRDAASSESVHSYELPSAEEGRLTRSLPPPDHDVLLHFDFTIPSASSSQADSLQL
ncbi:hypothetical protein LdCL_150013300 [Leishmania donovani]|uniref:Uncharacterized protein n=1 Tax=Leishmania donovani TaxID=5661 RepID=A0A3S7WTM2_LEIDO|nr:hypothetical protein LdCL_150013300 [Leishmania donovani]